MSTKPHPHRDDPADADRKPVPSGEPTLSACRADPNRIGADRQFPRGLDPQDV